MRLFFWKSETPELLSENPYLDLSGIFVIRISHVRLCTHLLQKRTYFKGEKNERTPYPAHIPGVTPSGIIYDKRRQS